LFIGAASGGVWKSEDGGTRYKPVFDEQPVQSIGAIALDPKNTKNVWVGTGEPWTRNSVSIGDGIYKSTDGGETWNKAGLPTSERISQILVSPKNSDTVYAAVPGALWSDSPDRGLYKTTDGGKTWKLILKGPNLSTGASTIALDPTNPNKIFAGLWDFRRAGWTFRSGGNGPNEPSGSGLFLSNDGGTTWKEITPENNKGFPKKPYGRLAVAIAPSNAKRVYAFVESPDSALYVSDDGGQTWALTSIGVSGAPYPCSNCGFAFLGAQLTMAIGNDDSIYLLYNSTVDQTDGAPERIYFVKSTDHGASYSVRQDVSMAPQGVEHSFPAITTGASSGDVRIAWTDTRTGSWNLFYRSSTNGGASWSGETRISSYVPGYNYITPTGFGLPYGDYFQMAVDDRGSTQLAWGEAGSYAGPGNIWTAHN